ncbi:PREDICTED: splicing factor 3B subunit 4-like [Corvus brachyrhynchos]|uniref:splicing factor 3B subunit 4-like n=1 Tax=Corvus brachyrhynchos TaxID=85066 RepID=UPI0008165D58|nr:PREDICTED: splicing factor 3B subunit 4-like [Corvus brachyrhynchos]
MDISLSVLLGTTMERDACDSDTCIPRRAWRPTEGRIASGISFGMLPGSMPAKQGNLSCTGRSQPLCPQPPPGPLFTQLGQISHRGDRCPQSPSPSLPCPKEFVSHSRGRAINVSPPRVCSVRGDSVACHHGSCCLLPDFPRAPGACGQGLPTPGAGARGKSPSTLETVAAPSPGGTRDAAGGDGPREFGTPSCVSCPHAHEVGVPVVGRKPTSRPRVRHPKVLCSRAVPCPPPLEHHPAPQAASWDRARLTSPGGHGHNSPPTGA